jgi:metal-responsive CopG/Arc/MetJ family transcriptional regulator
MVSLSLKLDEHIFQETEALLKEKKQSRNSYINEAIDYYNKAKKRMKIAQQLSYESALVRTSSQEVLREFEAIEDDFE